MRMSAVSADLALAWACDGKGSGLGSVKRGRGKVFGEFGLCCGKGIWSRRIS